MGERSCSFLRRIAVLTSIIVTCGVGSTVAKAKSTWSDSAIAKGLVCIHKYEMYGHPESWDEGYGTYRGGLQMDENFENAYGKFFVRKWGRSNNWPIWAQIRAGINGARARGGFNAWPETRISCGLPYYF